MVKYSGHLLNALARSKIMSRLRQDLSSSLIDLNLSFNDKKSGELMSRVITDAQAVGQGVVSVTHRILHSSLLIIVYFIFLINTSSRAYGDNFNDTGCPLFNHYYIKKNPVKKYEILNFEAMAALTASLQEVFSNIRLIQSNLSSRYSNKSLDGRIKILQERILKRRL